MNRKIYLDHDYSIDENYTLLKAVAVRSDEVHNCPLAFHPSLSAALKTYADRLMGDGIHDGSIKTVNDCIIKLETIAGDIDKIGKCIERMLR